MKGEVTKGYQGWAAAVSGEGIMDLINSYCHSVYLSVLMNPANQRGWSDLITRDLLDKFHGLALM